MNNCKTCKFFKPNHQQSSVGACVRYPPMVCMIQHPAGNFTTETIFPTLTEQFWCGEHVEKLSLVKETGNEL